MTPIKFTTPVGNTKGETLVTNENDTEWYSYANKQWANAQTRDGSMWVWIPRYAYRMVYTDPSDKSVGGTVDVVFLIGETDTYYDANGNIQTAKRAKSADEVVDTTTGYTVHPAFTDESGINYANGGWDKELTGFWVAKFEAGFAGGNNNAPRGVSSGIYYTQDEVVAPSVETGNSGDTYVTPRNWTDGQYGTNITSMKYPTFQGVSYSMNYICISDSYNLSRALTNSGNIYGLSKNLTDSHLMKNSEWGAVAYLSQSKYGLNNEDIYNNNVSLHNSTQSIYAVTGCCAKTPNEAIVKTTIEEINNQTADVYVWSQMEGQKASCTGTIYGIYDMSGGLWDVTSGYVANGDEDLKKYGASVAYNKDTLRTISTKYTTVYPYDSNVDNEDATDKNIVSDANYKVNTKIYGDAIRETSKEGASISGWNGDYSYFWGYVNVFSMRGAMFTDISNAGINAFGRTRGYAHFQIGLRAVLVAQ